MMQEKLELKLRSQIELELELELGFFVFLCFLYFLGVVELLLASKVA
jgi:hypothetical protein